MTKLTRIILSVILVTSMTHALIWAHSCPSDRPEIKLIQDTKHTVSFDVNNGRILEIVKPYQTKTFCTEPTYIPTGRNPIIIFTFSHHKHVILKCDMEEWFKKKTVFVTSKTLKGHYPENCSKLN